MQGEDNDGFEQTISSQATNNNKVQVRNMY